MNFFSLKVAYYDAKCRSLKFRRRITNWLVPAAGDPQYLFILCPAYCGSTLMHEILRSSPAVSPNNIYGTCEGQSLPEFRQLIDYRKRWEPDYDYPWEAIKQIWHQYWDHSKPLLLDKSPPNLLRTSSIAHYFDPARFVAMVRNPYVHCEALMRRDQLPARLAAERSLLGLEYQKRNLDALSEVLLVRYEDLVEDPGRVRSRLLTFLPLLNELEVNKKFKAHNYQNMPLEITNLNAGKIEKITANDLAEINEILSPHEDLLHFFGYSLYPGS